LELDIGASQTRLLCAVLTICSANIFANEVGMPNILNVAEAQKMPTCHGVKTKAKAAAPPQSSSSSYIILTFGFSSFLWSSMYAVMRYLKWLDFSWS
jgi:hypothetical protein